MTASRAFRYDFSDATNTDGNLPKKNLAGLSRKDHCFSTSSMEHFEVSPDAERHGGFWTLRKFEAMEWEPSTAFANTHLPQRPAQTRQRIYSAGGQRGIFRSVGKQVNGVFTRPTAKSHYCKSGLR